MAEKTYLPGPLGDVLKQIDKKIEALDKRRGDSMREIERVVGMDDERLDERMLKIEARISALEMPLARKRTPAKKTVNTTVKTTRTNH